MDAERTWPDSTFTWEDEKTKHFCGSHWDPFYESPDEVIKALPEMFPTAVPVSSFGDTYPGPRQVPGAWPTGNYLCWPNPNRGLITSLRVTREQTELINVSPLADYGVQVGLEIKKVHVWSSGAEAQIEGSWGDSRVSFYDLTFLRNRQWYEVGKRRDFILAGIAYEAMRPARETVALDPSSLLAKWFDDQAGIEGGPQPELSLEGSSIFLRVDEWDRDDYRFRGPVRKVTPFDDWLGQSGWKVRVCVMRFDAEEAELDVFVTGRAWSGPEPPKAGEDIEGTLWMQGRLWSAAQAQP